MNSLLLRNKPAPRIETGRAVVTLLQPQQARLLQQYYLENRAHMAPWEPLRDDGFYSFEAAQARIEQALQTYALGAGVAFAALDRDEREVLALCNFSNVVLGVFRACHLGFSVAKRHEGQGLMQEVVQAGIDYMFKDMRLHRVMANHMPANIRSVRLLQKLGFEREGYAKAYLQIAGRWEDHVLMSRINPADCEAAS